MKRPIFKIYAVKLCQGGNKWIKFKFKFGKN